MITEIDQQLKAIRDNASTTLIFRERSPMKPAFVLNRGEYDQPRDQVSAVFPRCFLHCLRELRTIDWDLAFQWLTAPNHPLTSRVTVNRFWQQFFGTGIVKTSEDFGSQGEQPSHPELRIGWLPQFMQPESSDAQHNWDTKHLMKTIVLSAAYRRNAKGE